MSWKTLAIVGVLLLLGLGFNLYDKQQRPETTLIPLDTPAQHTSPTIMIHVAGAVRHPGIYHMAPGLRVSDAIAQAGGFLETANVNKVNLAAKLKDGQRILVSEYKVPKSKSKASSKTRVTVVELNYASVDTLMQLPGMSAELAQAIVAFRDRHGPFITIETLTQIKGITPKRLAKWRDYLRV
jgi:competence protein ComEA